MSIFSDSIYARDEIVEPEAIPVNGIHDEELAELEKAAEEIGIIIENMIKKIELIDYIQAGAKNLVPNQIALIQKKQTLQSLYDARDKYLICIQNKNKYCSLLKQRLDKLITGIKEGDTVKSESRNTYIANRPRLDDLRGCLDVIRKDFPNFKALVNLKIKIDSEGYPMSVSIEDYESNMSPTLENFPKCIAHFSKDLNFKNHFERESEIHQTFIF